MSFREDPSHQGLHRLEAAFQVDRPEDGLEETGQNRVLFGAATSPLRATEANVVTEVHPARLGGECRRIDEGGARPGEIALRPSRVRPVEEPGDDQIQHCIAQELEALVASASVALVGLGRVAERGLEQIEILEGEAQVVEQALVGQTGLVAHGICPAIHPPPRTTSPS